MHHLQEKNHKSTYTAFRGWWQNRKTPDSLKTITEELCQEHAIEELVCDCSGPAKPPGRRGRSKTIDTHKRKTRGKKRGRHRHDRIPSEGLSQDTENEPPRKKPRYESSNPMTDMKLLQDSLWVTYFSATKRLNALFENHEITYDLLWALFKPNTVVYTTCFGTGKPRCVKYDFGEERTTNNGIEYFHLECRYVDFDGKVFGETSIELVILKFRGTKRINSLDVFPFEYHSSKDEIKANLVDCGRKFVSLMGVHHRQYRGDAFYMRKGQSIKVPVNSRVMIDAVYFQEANPNYTKPRNTPLLRSTKKRSLPTAGDKPQVQRIKRGRFSSSLSSGETETGDESDISSYTPLRPHISSAQPTSSHSFGLEGDTNDGMEFIGGRSRTVVIYEQQRWQGEIIKERDMKQRRGRPRKQYLVRWRPSWVDGARLTASGLVQNWKQMKASQYRY